MKTILITGANKGIGLAIAEAILREKPQYRVLLCARNIERGEAAKRDLFALDEAWSDRVQVLELDVASDDSVATARAKLQREAGDSPALYGLVNNAGVASGSFTDIVNVNLFGVQRVCSALAPLVEPGGRIVNVTSASGPNFVAECKQKRRQFFCDPEITWEELVPFVQTCQQLAPEEFKSLGMGSDSPYGFSKACANSYTLYLARRFPRLYVNACTPGFIETDLTRPMLGDRTPAEAGMKAPADGARVVMSLLFDDPRGTCHYYGSDALRSPLDRYRAPGSPEYTGS